MFTSLYIDYFILFNSHNVAAVSSNEFLTRTNLRQWSMLKKKKNTFIVIWCRRFRRLQWKKAQYDSKWLQRCMTQPFMRSVTVCVSIKAPSNHGSPCAESVSETANTFYPFISVSRLPFIRLKKTEMWFTFLKLLTRLSLWTAACFSSFVFFFVYQDEFSFSMQVQNVSPFEFLSAKTSIHSFIHSDTHTHIDKRWHTHRVRHSDTESLLQSGEVFGWSKQPTLQLSEYPKSLHFPCKVVEGRAWRRSGHAQMRVDLSDPVFICIKERQGRERWVGRGYGVSWAPRMEGCRGKEDRNVCLELVCLFLSAYTRFSLRFRGKPGITACAVDVKVFTAAIFAEIVLGTCVVAVHVVIVVAVWIVTVACLFTAVLIFNSQQSSPPPPPLHTFFPLLLLSLRPALPLSPPPSPPSLSPLPFSIPLPLRFISSCSVPHSSQATLRPRCLVPQRGRAVHICPLILRRQKRCVFLRRGSVAVQGWGVAQGVHQPWDGAQESTQAGAEVKEWALEVRTQCGACQLTHSAQQNTVGSLVLCQTGTVL